MSLQRIAILPSLPAVPTPRSLRRRAGPGSTKWNSSRRDQPVHAGRPCSYRTEDCCFPSINHGFQPQKNKQKKTRASLRQRLSSRNPLKAPTASRVDAAPINNHDAVAKNLFFFARHMTVSRSSRRSCHTLSLSILSPGRAHGASTLNVIEFACCYETRTASPSTYFFGRSAVPSSTRRVPVSLRQLSPPRPSVTQLHARDSRGSPRGDEDDPLLMQTLPHTNAHHPDAELCSWPTPPEK